MELLKPALPWIFLSLGILITMLVSLIRVETRKPAQFMAGITLLFTFVSSIIHFHKNTSFLFQNTFEASSLTYGVLALFSGIGLLFIFGFSHYLTKEKLHLSDYYHLLLILILGATTLTASKSLLMTFIALELMSLPAYALTGFRRNDPRSNEAALKYFILGGVLGAVFLLGAAFLFGATGSIYYGEIYSWSMKTPQGGALFFVGHVLVMIAFLFKVASVPFHFWKPDVYEGAPVSVTGVMTTVISCASMISLLRLVHIADFSQDEWRMYAEHLQRAIRVLSVLSLVVGSLVMIAQKNLKRMLAYSAISHTGYLLLALLPSFSSAQGLSIILAYLCGYSVMSCGVFVLLSLSEFKADSGVELVDLTGLMKRAPIHAGLWTVFFLSMIGMPFTVGFFTKYLVLMSAVNAGEVTVAILAVICAVVSAYGYLRPVALMVMRDPDPGASPWSNSYVSQFVAALAAAATIFLGIMPNGMLQLVRGIELIH